MINACAPCGDRAEPSERLVSWSRLCPITAYSWCLSRRRRNKEYYALHGNPLNYSNSFEGFSADAQLGIGILRARAEALTISEVAESGVHAAAESDGDRASFHSADEFDVQLFAAVDTQGPVVVSLAEALGLVAIQAMDEVCAAVPAPAMHMHRSSLIPGGAASGRVECPRCSQQLVAGICSGSPCVRCSMPPTPGGQGLLCEQCGVQFCTPCTHHLTSEGHAPSAPLGQPTLAAGEALSPSGSGLPAGSQPAEGHDSLADVSQQLNEPQVQEGRRRRRRRMCAGCSRGLRGRMLDDPEVSDQCTYCSNELAAGARVFECSPCGTTLCLACTPLTGPQADSSHASATQDIEHLLANAERQAQLADGVAVGGPDGVPSRLRKLRLLPDAFPKPPPLWIPRRIKQQISVLLRHRIVEAVRSASAAPGDQAAELAHRLCKVAPQLLLRQASGADPNDEVDRAAGFKLVGIIRDRARIALNDGWEVLVDSLLQDLEQQRSAHVPPLSNSYSSRDEQGRLTPAAAQTSTVKARTGSLRGSKAVLTGGPPVPPGSEADACVQSLFCVEPLCPEKQSRLEESLAAAGPFPSVNACESRCGMLVSRQPP